jgi:hypothetical protein
MTQCSATVGGTRLLETPTKGDKILTTGQIKEKDISYKIEKL